LKKQWSEAYLDELQDVELAPETLDKVAGAMMPSICHREDHNICSSKVSAMYG